MNARIAFYGGVALCLLGAVAAAESHVRQISTHTASAVPMKRGSVLVRSAVPDARDGGIIATVEFPSGSPAGWLYLRQGEAKTAVIYKGAKPGGSLDVSLPFPPSDKPLEVVDPCGNVVASVPHVSSSKVAKPASPLRFYGTAPEPIDGKAKQVRLRPLREGDVRFIEARRTAKGLYVELLLPRGLPRNGWFIVRQGQGCYVMATNGAPKGAVLSADIPFPKSTEPLEIVDPLLNPVTSVPSP